MIIKKLSRSIVDKIAAGEVIEKPASVVRELIDNAIDADAKNIEIIIRNGGKSYISVTDDGCGMEKDDLSACIDRHTTSKLSEENLYKITTLGFRGEALFSIGTVSKISISSCQNSEAWKIVMKYGEKEEIIRTSLNQGTQIEIWNLLFNIPARLRFLRSSAIERKSIEELVIAFAMLYWNISFSLFLDDDARVLSLSFPAMTDFAARIFSIIQDDFDQNAIYCLKEDKNPDGIHKIEGILGLPTFNKSSPAYQYIFINGRLVRDPIISNIMRKSYRDYIPNGRYAVYVISITAPPEVVDINVHPAKSEIKFRDNKYMHYFISSAIKESFDKIQHRSKMSSKIDLIFNDFPSNYSNQSHQFNSDESSDLLEPLSSSDKVNSDDSDKSMKSDNMLDHVNVLSAFDDDIPSTKDEIGTSENADYISDVVDFIDTDTVNFLNSNEIAKDSESSDIFSIVRLVDEERNDIKINGDVIVDHNSNTDTDASMTENAQNDDSVTNDINNSLFEEAEHFFEESSTITDKFETNIEEFFSLLGITTPDSLPFSMGSSNLINKDESRLSNLMESGSSMIYRDYSLGKAIGQICESYIISEVTGKDGGAVIIDQHAAHERILYEKMKADILKENGLQSQGLIVPIEIDLTSIDPSMSFFEKIKSICDTQILKRFGFEIVLQDKLCKVIAVPNFIKLAESEEIIKDLFCDLIIEDNASPDSIVHHYLERICASLSCHASIKAGQKLSIPEMNALIGQMQDVNFSGQCNHGRPTHVFIKLQNLHKIFERT